jgi:hypothetical protein
MTTAPAEVDLTIYQGQDWYAIFQLYADTANTIPFDLTGYEVDMHIREGVADSQASILIAASTRTTGDGADRIKFCGVQSSGEIDEDGNDPASGIVKVTISAAVSSAVSPSKRPRKGGQESVEFVYDVELTASDGTVTRIMRGVITFDLEVTRRT